MRQFLYPAKLQFPFDEVCGQIVRALEARAWKVPGFTVEIREYGSGQQLLRYVNTIQSDQSAIDLGHHDVRIEFGRPQGVLPEGRFNDCAAVNEIRLPRRSLRVYDDESGPTYNVYVGDAWERDRSTWWSRPNARLNNEPRLCVRYSGWRSYGRAATLAWDKDGREYGPEGAEPQTFDVHTVMEEFRSYLQEVVLTAIEAYPTAEAPAVYEEPATIPMPANMQPLFAYADGSDVRRIELGKKCIDELRLADRYAMHSGWRLAPLGIKKGPDLPEVAYDGFIWCATIGTAGWRIPDEYYRTSADHLIKVTPKNARGIYVADHAAYEKRREVLSAALKKEKRDRFTDAEVNDFLRARACTIVPITEYKGGFEEPVYLINRELGFDEVEVIGKRPR